MRADSGRIVIDGADLSRMSDADLHDHAKAEDRLRVPKFNLLPTLDTRSNILSAQNIAGKKDQNDLHLRQITRLLGWRGA